MTVIKVQIYNLHSYLSYLAQKCTNTHLPQPYAAQEHPEISSHCFWGTVKWARPLNIDKLIDSEPFSLAVASEELGDRAQELGILERKQEVPKKLHS